MTIDHHIPRANERTIAPDGGTGSYRGRHTRRDVVSHGVKLAFVAPVISTFFAKDAYAGSGYCSPVGAACTQDSECCSGHCDTLSTNLCVP